MGLLLWKQVSMGPSELEILYFFWGVGVGVAHSMACGVLLSRPEIEPKLLSLEVQSLNYRTIRELSQAAFLGKRYPRQ